VIVTPGSKHAIYCCIMVTVNPEEEVILPDPCFPSYEHAVHLVGGRAKKILLKEELNFGIDPDKLEEMVTPKTKMILINSPHNPTGSVLVKEALERIAEIAEKYGLLILSDEVYEKFLYDDAKHYCLLGFPGLKDFTVVTNSFSKTYAMTGWRLGYAVGNKAIIDKIRKVQEASTTCAPSMSQAAGIVALRSSQDSTEEMRKQFDRRRRFLVHRLNQIHGLSCKMPQGAFFVFPNISKLRVNSLKVSEYLLREFGVVTVPGVGFGENGKDYIRISYATSFENIERGAEQIELGMNRLLSEVSSKICQ